MKVLVLTKRQYMGKDLLDDEFGRFRELPLGLAQLGHKVTGIALSYRQREETARVDQGAPDAPQVRWHSINLFRGVVPALGRFAGRAMQIGTEFQPDVIWAGSDAYHAIFADWLAKRLKIRCVMDLYDNFEAFGASRIPTVLSLFRKAVREADGVTCFSKRLAEHVTLTYPRTKPTVVVETGVRKDIFYPRDQQECRQRLRLPESAAIIGTAGALDDSRGVKTLFEAFRLLTGQGENIHLALAGPRPRRMKIPIGPHVHDLGILPHDQVPILIGALDLAVVCYRHSAQGQFSFPQKTYEIMACRKPLVAAAVGTMSDLLSDTPQYLYDPEDPANLAAAATRQLRDKRILDRAVPSWADSAKQLESFLHGVGSQPSLRVHL